jgi:hypothetical protein
MRQIMLVGLFLLTAGTVYWGVGKLGERMSVHYGARELYPRFLEKDTSYEIADVQNFVKNKPRAARYYVFPLLFPLDLLVLILLGGAMAYASVMSARYVGVPTYWIWLTLLLPTLYVAVDLVEDTLLALLLTDESSRTVSFVGFIKAVTTVKLGAIYSAIAQTVALLAVVPLRGFVRAIWQV